MSGILFILPLIFHGQRLFFIQPDKFSQGTVIVMSFLLVAMAVSAIPLSVRLFLVWSVVTVFTSMTPMFSAIAVCAVCVAVFVYRWLRTLSIDDYTLTYKTLALACITQVFWSGAQLLNRDFVMNLPRDFHMVFGTIGNKNPLGAFFLLCLVPVFCFKKWAALLPALGIMYCKSSAAIYAMFGGFLFALIFWPMKRVQTKRFLIYLVIVLCMWSWEYVGNPVKRFKDGRGPVWGKIVKLMFSVEDPRERVFSYYMPGIKANARLYLEGIEESKEEKEYKKRGAYLYYNKPEAKKSPGAPVKFKKDFKYDTVKGNIDNIYSKMQTTLNNLNDAWDIKYIERVRNPWLGYGLGTFRFEFPQKLTWKEAGGVSVDSNGKEMKDGRGEYIPIQWYQAHNLWLQVGREQGLIGMFLVLCIPGMAIAKFLRSPKTEMSIVWTAGIVMFSLNGIGFFTDRVIVLMFLMLYTLARQNKETVS